MYNFFTKSPVPEAMVKLKYDRDVKLEPNEMIYHAYNAIRNRTYDGKEKNFAYIKPEETENPRLVVKELDFLDHFGLITGDVSDGFYVSPLAMIFYLGGDDAIFGSDLALRLSSLSPSARELFFRPLMNLLTEFTLPGRQDWVYESRGTLPDSIHLVQRLEQEDADIASILEKIRNDY
jgi:hypothetical protein